MKNWRICIALAALLCALMICAVAAADTQTGACGANGADLTWTMTDDGALTISGSGAMADYSLLDAAPWGTAVTEAVIEDGVTRIGDFAFAGCDSLTDITIAGSVTEIGENAFHNCTGLAEVTVPYGVTELGADAFLGCTGLTRVTLADSVTTIGDFVFYGCAGLMGVAIPNSVTSIADDAFSGCSVTVFCGENSAAEAHCSANGLPYRIDFGICGADGSSLTWSLSPDLV